MTKRASKNPDVLGNLFDRILSDKYGTPKKTMTRARKARGIALLEKHLPKKPPKQDVALAARPKKGSWKLVRASRNKEAVVKSVRLSKGMWTLMNKVLARRVAAARLSAKTLTYGDVSTFMRRLMFDGLLRRNDLTPQERKQVSLHIRACDLSDAARDAESLGDTE